MCSRPIRFRKISRWTLLFAIAGLGAGFVWLRSFSRRTGTHPAYQPVVLRRVLTTLPVS